MRVRETRGKKKKKEGRKRKQMKRGQLKYAWREREKESERERERDKHTAYNNLAGEANGVDNHAHDIADRHLRRLIHWERRELRDTACMSKPNASKGPNIY